MPHMGWNAMEKRIVNCLKVHKEEFVYFVHSFYIATCDFTAATTDYIHRSVLRSNKVTFHATQFHPEKVVRQEKILTNFLNL